MDSFYSFMNFISFFLRLVFVCLFLSVGMIGGGVMTNNYDWNSLRAFVTAVELGTFTAAAKALKVSQPTLSRQIDSLEVTLGGALFERVGRGIEPTPLAGRLLPQAQRMVQASEELALIAKGNVQAVEGEVTIACTETAATYELPAILVALKKEFPAIRVNLLSSNNTSDLRRREADIAVRAYEPNEPDLIAKKLGGFKAQLYASKGYIERLAQSPSMASLEALDFIGFHGPDENQSYIDALSAKGLKIREHQFVASSNSHVAHWSLAKSGLGIGVMTRELGDADEDMCVVLPEDFTFEGELWLVSHRELRTNLRVKTVFDFLYQQLRVTMD